jgi:hypothetical protein
MLIWNEAHLKRVLVGYVDYYNTRRPHQGLGQDTPEGLKLVSSEGEIHRRDVLGHHPRPLSPGSLTLDLPLCVNFCTIRAT